MNTRFWFLMPFGSCLLAFLLFIGSTPFAQSNNKTSYTLVTPAPVAKVEEPKGKKVKNVILMIGDGMGLVQVSSTWVANRGHLHFDNFRKTGFSRTTAANKLITDSGASATAMASGKKTTYHSVGVDTLGNPLEPLTEKAFRKGMSTAILVTCGITDATPAAFLANNIDRNEEEEIALDFLKTNVDYIFGGGRTQFTQRKDQRNILEEMKARGYQTPTNWSETKAIRNGKIIALLEDGQLPLAEKRGNLQQEAVQHALSIISKNKKGFFAMVEGSRIDDCGHWNDLPKLIEEVIDFDQTIGTVLQWAAQDKNTLVIVVADHETGGLTLLDGNVQLGYVKGHFSTGGHSGTLVPVYAFGPQSSQFTGIYENSELFTKIAAILKLQ